MGTAGGPVPPQLLIGVIHGSVHAIYALAHKHGSDHVSRVGVRVLSNKGGRFRGSSGTGRGGEEEKHVIPWRSHGTKKARPQGWAVFPPLRAGKGISVNLQKDVGAMPV
jgi:hypothetical protein